MTPDKMSNENHVKAEVRKMAARLGAWTLMHVPMGYGKQGTPDFLLCLHGRLIAIETKFRTNRISPHQARELGKLHDAGGIAIVANERGLALLEDLLNVLDANPQRKLYNVINLSFDAWDRPVKHQGIDWEVTWGN